jgi:hypothetical protein
VSPFPVSTLSSSYPFQMISSASQASSHPLAMGDLIKFLRTKLTLHTLFCVELQIRADTEMTTKYIVFLFSPSMTSCDHWPGDLLFQPDTMFAHVSNVPYQHLLHPLFDDDQHMAVGIGGIAHATCGVEPRPLTSSENFPRAISDAISIVLKLDPNHAGQLRRKIISELNQVKLKTACGMPGADTNASTFSNEASSALRWSSARSLTADDFWQSVQPRWERWENWFVCTHDGPHTFDGNGESTAVITCDRPAWSVGEHPVPYWLYAICCFVCSMYAIVLQLFSRFTVSRHPSSLRFAEEGKAAMSGLDILRGSERGPLGLESTTKVCRWAVGAAISKWWTMTLISRWLK